MQPLLFLKNQNRKDAASSFDKTTSSLSLKLHHLPALSSRLFRRKGHHMSLQGEFSTVQRVPLSGIPQRCDKSLHNALITAGVQCLRRMYLHSGMVSRGTEIKKAITVSPQYSLSTFLFYTNRSLQTVSSDKCPPYKSTHREAANLSVGLPAYSPKKGQAA